MNKVQSILKNMGVLFFSQVLNYILSFFILVYSARYLGVEGFGVLSFAIAFAGILVVFMDIGLSTLTIRELARDKSILHDFISNIISIKIILALITFCLIFLLVNILGYPEQTISVVYFIAIYTIFSSFSQLFYSVFQAHEKMEIQSAGVIINVILLLIGIEFAIYNQFTIIEFSAVYALVGCFILLYSLTMFYRNFFFPKIKFDLRFWKELINESWPFAITGIALNLYLWIDTIILSLIQGQESVGLYNASYRLISVILFIPTVFNTVMFPLMSQYYISSKKSFILTFKKLLNIMMIIAIPIGFATIVIADKVIIFVYGGKYIGSAFALQILVWSAVLIFIRSPIERLMESSNKQIVVTKVYIIGVILNIILNIIVIPKYDFVGAGLVTVLTDVLLLILLLYATKKIGISFSKEIKINLMKIILASIIMFTILQILRDLNLFILIVIGTIIYFLILLILKIFDDDDINMIKSIFNR